MPPPAELSGPVDGSALPLLKANNCASVTETVLSSVELRRRPTRVTTPFCPAISPVCAPSAPTAAKGPTTTSLSNPSWPALARLTWSDAELPETPPWRLTSEVCVAPPLTDHVCEAPRVIGKSNTFAPENWLLVVL